MKKSALVIAILFLFTLSGCAKASPPKGMTPEETVKYHFAQFNSKNQPGMDSVVYKKMRGADSDFGNLKYVKLTSCKEETDTTKIDYVDGWYKNPYKVALVNATFDIKYNGTGSANAGLSNGTYNWKFHLVKADEKSDWMIVMWGE